jgi:hypothetical protein
MICVTGKPCPESGYWKAFVNSYTEHIHYFECGQIMPAFKTTVTHPRPWPFNDKTVEDIQRIEWGLLG